MPWLDAVLPARMTRIALVAPEESLREVLVRVADAGAVEVDGDGREQDATGPAARLLAAARPGDSRPVPALSVAAPNLDELARAGRYDLLAGEAELEAHTSAVLRRAGTAGLVGWMPAARVPELTARIASLGGAVVPLPHPRGSLPPTLLDGPPARRSVRPLVRTYGTVPYADIDPSWLAWFSYVFMFGMMFGDAGEGLLLIAAAVTLWAGWPAWARRYRAAWPFAAGGGVAATVAGLLYGEFFGPTGLVRPLWLDPLSEPITLLVAAVGAGAVLLAGAYVVGIVNRWREGGWPLALYAPSGIAGASAFAGFGAVVGGWYTAQALLLGVGAAFIAAGLGLAFTGFLAGAGGGGTGVAQASAELFDLTVRLGSNVVSFTRLAAFGLTHAAIGLLVWDGARALWHGGGAAAAAAVAVFAAGTTLALALELLIVAIQALRLEYYELFSRVFQLLGREFQPWYVPASSDGQRPERAVGTPGGNVPGDLGGSPRAEGGE